MTYTVVVLVDGQWQKLAWSLSQKEARKLVLEVSLLHGVPAELRKE